MSRIALMAVDSDYPNLALMKIAAYHKRQGDSVEWYNPFDEYDTLYMSKIFGFTPDYPYHINNVANIIKGGTGYDLQAVLPEEMEYLAPDYSMYPTIDKRTAYSFLTRGCPNHCKWCVVPKKEGNIKPYQTIQDIAVDGRDHIILMDNNVLASDYGIAQIEEIIRLGVRVDFNQSLNGRRIWRGGRTERSCFRRASSPTTARETASPALSISRFINFKINNNERKIFVSRRWSIDS